MGRRRRRRESAARAPGEPQRSWATAQSLALLLAGLAAARARPVAPECVNQTYYSAAAAEILAADGSTELLRVLNNLVDGQQVVSAKGGALLNAVKLLAAYQAGEGAEEEDDDEEEGDVEVEEVNEVLTLYQTAPVDADDAGKNGWELHQLVTPAYGISTKGKDALDLFNYYAALKSIAEVRTDHYFDWCRSGCTGPMAPKAAADTAIDDVRVQPPSDMRGDIARAVFYLVTRYDEGKLGDMPSEDPDDDDETRQITLSNCPNTVENRMGKLATLIEWHMADPVDAWERRRNDIVCSEFQGNRNPYVDIDGLAQRVFCQYQDPDPDCPAVEVSGCGTETTCANIGALVLAETGQEVACDSIKSMCVTSQLVRERCRVTCNTCSAPPCQDLAPTGLQWDDGREVECSEAAHLCSDDMVLNACPNTCGACNNKRLFAVSTSAGSAPTSGNPPLPTQPDPESDSLTVGLIGVTAAFVLGAVIASLVAIRRRRRVQDLSANRALPATLAL